MQIESDWAPSESTLSSLQEKATQSIEEMKLQYRRNGDKTADPIASVKVTFPEKLPHQIAHEKNTTLVPRKHTTVCFRPH